MDRAMRKRLRVCGQRRPRYACASAQSVQGLRHPLTESLDTIECNNGEQMPGWDFAHAWDKSESFFLPLLCPVNSDHDNRFGLWHISFKKKKKKKNEFCDTATSRLKTIYKNSSGERIHTYPMPNPRILYFSLKPINCLSRDSFGCKVIPSCNCPGIKKSSSDHPCMH